jgi:hypothetical protein
MMSTEAVNKTEEKQLTLPEVLVREEEPKEPKNVYSTEWFEMKATEDQIYKFVEKTEKTTKTGPKHDVRERKFMKMDFVQKRMRPLASSIEGEYWESSRLAFFKEVFGEGF